jgi:hypothetical protein
LEKALVLPEECDHGPTCLLSHLKGEQVPPIPPDARRCPRYGEAHAVVVTERIITSWENLERGQA